MGGSFAFLDPGPLVDGDLCLVVPEPRWVEPFLTGCRQAPYRQRASELGRVSRQGLLDFLAIAPGGRFPGDPVAQRPPAYHWWMVQSSPASPVGKAMVAGAMALRIGDSADLRTYVGHVGYNVFPARRGQHLAERSCRLVLPLARRHGMAELWITANPENLASRRTCERLGATLVDTVAVPRDHELHRRGERLKCRYRLPL